VLTDGRRLQQILFNLLGNALKFGRNGDYVDFTVLVKSSEDSKEQILRLEVKDFGQGIDLADLDFIFQPFQQGINTEKEYGGTGLGLAITFNLVKAMGGKIAVASEPGEWCEFSVELPLQGVDKRHVKDSESSAADSKCKAAETNRSDAYDNKSNMMCDRVMGFSDLNVLIAEDNLVNQKVCSRSLSRLGMKNIDIVDNGQKAVDVSAEKNYHVIFMDCQMPVMDGLDATRLIVDRRKDQKDCPRIIMLTAHALKEYQDKAKQAGCDGFISKPFNLKAIESMLGSMGFQKD
jgi:CheY-like chemotaxis protein